MSIGVTECDSSICTFCSARAKASALSKRSAGFFAMDRCRTRSSDAGASVRPSDASGSRSMRSISSALVLRDPATSNGDRPASSV